MLKKRVTYIIAALGIVSLCVCLASCEDEDAYMCTNSCPTAYSGTCDDGGQGSVAENCDFGTDCNDCGIRYTTQHSH